MAARTPANATKTVPQLRLITPRWFTHMLSWVPVEAGIYRVNKVKDPNNITVDCSQKEEEREFDTTYVDYEEWGREYYLSAVNTVVDIHTRVSTCTAALTTRFTNRFVRPLKSSRSVKSGSFLTTRSMACSETSITT